MENKLNELEARKAELEKAFEEKKKYAQALTNDIALMEQLLSAKREHSKTMNELNGIAQEHSQVCAEIETIKATDKPEETEKKE